MNYIHKNLAAGRWFQLTLPEQLGNIGSEYYRACKAKGKDEGRFRSAVERTLELCNFTANDSRWNKHQLKEIALMQEQVSASFSESTASHQSLQKYFDSFAILARR